MKKIIYVILYSALLGSCIKDITKKNVDPINPASVPSYTLFTNGQKQMADLLATSSVNTNIFRMLTQYWTETTYTEEANYDLSQRNIPRQWWNGFYRDVLKSFDE